MDPLNQTDALISRARFLRQTSLGLGSLALASLLDGGAMARPNSDPEPGGFPNFAPRARRVIYLFQSGAPSQMDLFDHKPLLERAAAGPSCPTRSARASGSPA